RSMAPPFPVSSASCAPRESKRPAMANRMQGAEPGNQDATGPGEPDGGFQERVIPGVAEDPRVGAIKRRRALVLLASLALVVGLMGVLVSKLVHLRKASEEAQLRTA